jgi:hypothetical protein
MISRCLATRGAPSKPQVAPHASVKKSNVQLVEPILFEVLCAGVHIISNLKALAFSIALAMATSLVRLILASSLATSSSSLLIRSSSSVSGAHKGVGRAMSNAVTRDVTESTNSHTKEMLLLKSAAYESKVAKLRQLLDRGGRAAAMHVITDFDLTLTAPGSLQCHHMFGRYEVPLTATTLQLTCRLLGRSLLLCFLDSLAIHSGQQCCLTLAELTWSYT